MKQLLESKTPWMNAAGTMGYAPSENWRVALPQGVFVTNPVSLHTRTPAHSRMLLEMYGSVFLHTGLPNPGFKEIVKKYARWWKQSELPIWVHILAENTKDIAEMVLVLEEMDHVQAIELGLNPQISLTEALACIEAASGELPVVACVPFEMASHEFCIQMAAHGASAISLQSPRASIRADAFDFVNGRMDGPFLFPLTLNKILALSDLNIPIIAGAGVNDERDAQDLLDAGAWAVQFHTMLWRG